MSPTARRTHGPLATDAPPVDIGPTGPPVHSVLAVFFALGGAALAQPGGTVWSEPPRLPSPPALSHYLFEAPLVPAMVAAGLSLAVAWSLLRAERPRQGLLAGLLGCLGALGLVVVGGVVETSRERVIERSLAIARAVGQGDGMAAGAWLAPNLYLKMGPTGSATGSDDREVVIRAARMFPERVRLEAFAAPSGHAVVDTPTTARTRLRVRTGGGMGPSLSWWQLGWRLDPDGEWRVYTIELLLFNGETPPTGFSDEARRAVP